MTARILLRPELAEVSRLNTDFDAFFGDKNEAVENLKVCLNEAVTNTISYGFDDGAEGEIVVQLGKTDAAVSAVVSDNGSAFDPLGYDPAEPADNIIDAAIGGLGIKLMRSMTSEISYERRAGRNILRMICAL